MKQKKSKRLEVIKPSRDRTSRLSRLFPLLLVIGLTAAAFVPVLWNRFLYWDDYDNLVENFRYRGLGWSEIRWMFTTFHMSLYRPLTWVTLGLDYLVWGMNPLGYHLTSLFLHVINAILFYHIALRLLSVAVGEGIAVGDFRLPAASAFAALFFAIHPLRVEAVAWASARNDVLSALFFFLTILCYLRALFDSRFRSDRRRWMAAALVVYLFSLLSKAIGMTLPFVLLLLDVYPLRRLKSGRWFDSEARQVWWEKLPFFLLAIAAAVIALLAKRDRALASLEGIGWGARLFQPLFGAGFYLWKTLVPLSLSPLYPLPSYFNPLNGEFLTYELIVVILTALFFLLRKRWPAALAVWIYYLVVLAPVSGIAQSGPQIVADRYSYLACLGWALLAGAGLYWCSKSWEMKRARYGPALMATLALGVVAVMAGLTWQQAKIWRDDGTLWNHALAVAPESASAQLNLGNFLQDEGKTAEAISHLTRAVEIEPSHARAHYSLGLALLSRGELDNAVEHLHRAVEIAPSFAKAHNNLGNVYAVQGKFDDAVEHFRQAVAIDPSYAKAHNNLGRVLMMRGKLEDALSHFRDAVSVEPSYGMARLSLGAALAQQGNLAEAAEQLKIAVELEPDATDAHEALARVLALQGHKEEAVKHYQEAVRLLKSRGVPKAGGQRSP